MVTTGQLAGQGSEPERPRPDIRLDPEDRADLLDLIAGAFSDLPSSRRLLTAIQYPAAMLPGWPAEGSAIDWWEGIFARLDPGLVEQGYRRLLSRATRLYQGNEGFYRLYQRYISEEPPETARTCHVFFSTRDPQTAQQAAAELTALGLNPQMELATEHVVAYTVSSSDVTYVRSQLERSQLPWTVAGPEGAHYLLRDLVVQGPDGSRFRLQDTPAAVSLTTLASEVVASGYTGKDPAVATRGTVINNVGEDGEQQRLNPEQTLADANIQDGARLQIGFESRAGSSGPDDREAALGRVRRQIVGFGRSHGIEVRADTDFLPTRYDLAFNQRSFGPPPEPGGTPTTVERHRVRILLVPGFPATAPKVFWLTPYYHPNVFPTYDCERTAAPGAPRGLVCLGQLADSWYPAKDFGEICRVILDIAAYRNYDVFGLDAAPDDTTVPRVNFYDPDAAMWAVYHQEEIEAMGGSPVIPVRRELPTVFRTTMQRIG
nr:hypothetical protein GCM10020063_018680 [Dactylosporangium thailandense]